MGILCEEQNGIRSNRNCLEHISCIIMCGETQKQVENQLLLDFAKLWPIMEEDSDIEMYLQRKH